MEIQLLFAPKVTGACCILHNVCAAEGDILKEEDEEEEEGSSQDDRDDNSDEDDADERELSGNVSRTIGLHALMSIPAEVPACLSEHDHI